MEFVPYSTISQDIVEQGTNSIVKQKHGIRLELFEHFLIELTRQITYIRWHDFTVF